MNTTRCMVSSLINLTRPCCAILTGAERRFVTIARQRNAKTYHISRPRFNTQSKPSMSHTHNVRTVWTWIRNKISPNDSDQSFEKPEGHVNTAENDDLAEIYTPHPEWLRSSERICLVWGNGTDGQLGIGDCVSYKGPQVLLSMIDRRLICMSAGYAHAIAIGEMSEEEGTGKGKLFAWGSNMYGQTAKQLNYFGVSTGLGGPDDDEDEDEQSVPLLVPGLDNLRFKECSAGLFHSVALGIPQLYEDDSDSDPNDVGSGHFDRAGTRTSSIVHDPRDAKTLVYAWGSALLGDGTTHFDSRPQHIKSLESQYIDHVYAGGHHTVATSSMTGHVYLWGWIFDSFINDERNGLPILRKITSPVQLDALNGKGIADVACGVWHTCFLTDDRRVYTIGVSNVRDILPRTLEIGNSSPFYVDENISQSIRVVDESDYEYEDDLIDKAHTNTIRSAATMSVKQIEGVPNITSCACGDGFTALLGEDGDVYVSGQNAYVNVDGPETKKVTFDTIEPITQIAAGMNYITALTSSGQLYVYGLIHARVYTAPQLVVEATSLTHIATGSDFCMAYTKV